MPMWSSFGRDAEQSRAMNEPHAFSPSHADQARCQRCSLTETARCHGENDPDEVAMRAYVSRSWGRD